MPAYSSYRLEALTAHCLANRYQIEMTERAYFLEHNEPNPQIDDLSTCPSDGVYIWIISDPNDLDYPRVGCSIHFWPVQPTPSEGGKDKGKVKKKDKGKNKTKNKKTSVR